MKPSAKQDSSDERSPVSAYMQYMTLGVQYAFGIGLATFAGRWIDGKFEVDPWGTLLGAAFGFIGSTVWLYQAVYSSPHSREEQHSNSKNTDSNDTDSNQDEQEHNE